MMRTVGKVDQPRAMSWRGFRIFAQARVEVDHYAVKVGRELWKRATVADGIDPLSREVWCGWAIRARFWTEADHLRAAVWRES